MPTPVPPNITEHAEMIRCVATALADSLDHNDNPYRAADKYIDVNTQLPRLLQLFLGESTNIERPDKVDSFSALVGATTVLAISIRHGGKVEWITEPRTNTETIDEDGDSE